jgi:hypothetical protein
MEDRDMEASCSPPPDKRLRGADATHAACQTAAARNRRNIKDVAAPVGHAAAAFGGRCRI